MDTARTGAVSRIKELRAEATATAVLQLKAEEFMEFTAVMIVTSFVEREDIVSPRRTFVNESNTTTSSHFFNIFCAEAPNHLFCVQNGHTFP